MTKYIKVKPETKAWELFNKLWTYEDRWIEKKKEIDEFLGFSMEKVLYLDTEELTIDRDKLPEKWEDMFKKNTHPAVAKKNSKINQQWKSFCKVHKLETFRTIDVTLALNIYGDTKTLYAPMNGEYYFETKEKERKTDWTKFAWAEIVDESTFLRLRADHLDKQKSA